MTWVVNYKMSSRCNNIIYDWVSTLDNWLFCCLMWTIFMHIGAYQSANLEWVYINELYITILYGRNT